MCDWRNFERFAANLEILTKEKDGWNKGIKRSLKVKVNSRADSIKWYRFGLKFAQL